MNIRTNHSVGLAHEKALLKGLNTHGLTSDARAFNPTKLMAETLALKNTKLAGVDIAIALGGPNAKRDILAKIKIDFPSTGLLSVSQGLSLKRSSKGKGASNQTYRGWIDQACLAAEKSVKAFSGSCCEIPAFVKTARAMLGLGSHAVRIEGKSSEPCEVQASSSTKAIARFSTDPCMQKAACSFALASLDMDFSQAALMSGSCGNRSAGILAIHYGTGHSNHMRGKHVMAIVNLLRSRYEESLKEPIPLLFAKAVANGKGRSIRICFSDASGKERSFMSIKRKGSSLDKFRDHLQIQLNLQGAGFLFEALEKSGTPIHAIQKVR